MTTATQNTTRDTTYTTEIYGMVNTMEADWTQASSPIVWNGESTQWQVADFGHRSAAAMRTLLARDIAIGEGCSVDELSDEINEEIDDAVKAMK